VQEIVDREKETFPILTNAFAIPLPIPAELTTCAG